MAENVTFGIKINVDDKGVGQATINVKELTNVINEVVEQTKVNPFKEWLSNVVGFEALVGALQRISGAVGELTDYYKQQEVAEAKLAQVMQNTMGATEADTQAILDLCSAQQKLGVIGDEVQLAGAQELATYLTERSTLESLIPVMNDMVAQQYGVNASQESAAQIATMLGKVMDGQVGALSRYGYKFDEAQETILKFGTEEERAAVLAEVVGAAVGGVNEALAQTSSGRMQQLANAVGDVKEQMGKLLVNVEPAINGLIGMGQTVISIKEIAPVIKNIGSAIGGMVKSVATATAAWIKHTAAVVANKAQLLAQAVAQKAVQAATVAWTAVQRVLNAVLTMNPIGLIITAIGLLVTAIITAYNNCEGFREVCDRVFAAIKNVATIVWDALVKAFEAVTGAIRKAWNWLKNFLGIGKKETKDQADALDSEADAANRTADAYKNLDKYKQQAAGSIKTSGTKSTATTQGKQAAPAGSIAAIDSQLQTLRTNLSLAIDTDSRVQVQRQIDELEAKKHLIEFEVELKMNGIDSIADALPQTKLEPINISVKGLPTLKATNIALAEHKQEAEDATKADRKLNRQANTTSEGIGAMSELMGSLSDVTRAANDGAENAASAWLAYGAAVAQSGAQMVAAILALIPAKEADTQTTNRNTTAKTANAASGFFSSFSSIPIVGIVLALAAVASMVATMLSMPKFAKGGIAYGPTLGLFGEYPGAANNPEVVAPLNRLRSLLGESDGGGGRVQFEIKGRRLVGVLAKENNVMTRR